jgi:Glu-tRNA(Gln) amidotransferase subunit E-like FAD-binding protein
VIVSVGALTVEIVQAKLAGVGSVLPAASVAVTVNVWFPSASPVYAFGLVQADPAPPSIVQLNVLPASVEVNEKLAFELFDGFVGLEVIVVSGAAVSIVQVKLAGVASVLPAASVAATVNVWLPAVRPV